MKAQHAASRPRGRPRAENAGQVDEIILETATALFLEKGFSRATMDQVAALSGTGKSSVYSRFASKQDLFGAVVQRSIATMFDNMEPLPAGYAAVAQLRHVGQDLLKNLLHPRCVALMRLTAAETANFPELAAMAYQVSLTGCVTCLSTSLALCGISHPEITAKRFVELVLQPAAFKALYGADVQVLINRCQDDINDALKVLLPDGIQEVA